MAAHLFAEAVEETLGFIDRAVRRIAQAENTTVELHNLRAYLMNLLELVERNPGVEAAADDLYTTASSAVAAMSPDDTTLNTGDARLLAEALDRLRYRLISASPSEHAKRLGLR